MLTSAVRLGLARTFEGEELIPSERFFAGGASSVRGYREEDLGPRSILGDASGGAALLIFNEELRFPIYRWLRGVGFVDLGNVYPTVDEISLADLQVGVGRACGSTPPSVSSAWIWASRPTRRSVRSEMARLLRPRARLLIVTARGWSS